MRVPSEPPLVTSTWAGLAAASDSARGWWRGGNGCGCWGGRWCTAAWQCWCRRGRGLGGALMAGTQDDRLALNRVRCTSSASLPSWRGGGRNVWKVPEGRGALMAGRRTTAWLLTGSGVPPARPCRHGGVVVENQIHGENTLSGGLDWWPLRLPAPLVIICCLEVK